FEVWVRDASSTSAYDAYTGFSFTRTAPCSGSFCNGVCVSPLTDPHNCGFCGNVCEAGTCNLGKCE
ncbi:MAG TPA: lipoprotein receptor, partial [Polyangiaceae bacterium]